MRQLRHHEQKLLKKVNFFHYKKESNIREIKVLRRYHIQDREDYLRYNKLCGHVTELVTLIKALDGRDPYRQQLTEQLLGKLYNIGLIPTKKGLSVCDKLSASAFCRRRLPVVMVRLKFAETLREAVTFVEQGEPKPTETNRKQVFLPYPNTTAHSINRIASKRRLCRTSGHIRVGPDVVTDPAFVVTRSLEDFLTWTDSSKIKRQVQKYNDTLDDFDLLDL
eukprot:SAG31_NODE_3315_length_4425_cov_6.309755_2_plen_222_part_00